MERTHHPAPMVKTEQQKTTVAFSSKWGISLEFLRLNITRSYYKICLIDDTSSLTIGVCGKAFGGI